MHYKNGREAKNGDKVVWVDAYGGPVTGVLYDAVAGNDYCNGKLAPISPGNPMPNLKECLHVDDVKAALDRGLAAIDFEKSRLVGFDSDSTPPDYAARLAAPMPVANKEPQLESAQVAADTAVGKGVPSAN